VTDVVICAEDLGKRYLIGHQADGDRYTALRDVIARGARGLGRSAADMVRGRPLVAGDRVEEFWALKDVSFEVKRGEVVGIIGRNGAGKSTLLKVLSRITEPSAGRVTIRGRVASLLEVGTGFHPELTGRENIYLNGAILGMTRAEIRRKFDEIVAFAEVERFLDTPVKRYSSGMYVRLAFAVAAHLDPEILIVDEVLAVGDTEFQRKCLGKMGEVASGGRTVLFVSHNMGAVRELCSRALVLQTGQVLNQGSPAQVIECYLRTTRSKKSVLTNLLTTDVPVNGIDPYIEKIALPSPVRSFGDTLSVEIDIAAPRETQVAIEIEIHDERGSPIAYVSTAPMLGIAFTVNANSRTRVNLEIGPLALATGKYDLFFWLIRPHFQNFHIIEQPLTFEILHSDPGDNAFEFKQSYQRGAFTLPMRWTCSTVP
jgi:lipopolysaccharide transport system ATP-binding protein